MLLLSQSKFTMFPKQKVSGLPEREFKCPCGKEYLSYPALFTHIKKKHDGKAPGKIVKPEKSQTKPFEKDPYIFRPGPQIREQSSSFVKYKQMQVPASNDEGVKAFRNKYEMIYQFSKELKPGNQEIRQNIWEEIVFFHHYENFVDTIENHHPVSTMTVGLAVTQFLRQVSRRSPESYFTQILLLFMLLLQYTADEINDQKCELLQYAPIQIILEYFNPFISYYIEDYSEYLGIQDAWVIAKNNTIKILLCFYFWLKSKSYTQATIFMAQ